MSLQSTEDAAAAVAVAPRVTLTMIEQQIAFVEFGSPAELLGPRAPLLDPRAMSALETCTMCFIVTWSGYIVIGTSKPISPANFNVALGRKLAREDAIRQLWPLEAYAMAERLRPHDDQTGPPPGYRKPAEGLHELAIPERPIEP